jgi:hypothetical protein
MANFEVIDALQRSLEKEGVLQSLRAQLRASVFRIISKGGQNHKNLKLQKFMASSDGKNSEMITAVIILLFSSQIGKIVLQLVQELLLNLNLTETLAVFEAETGLVSFDTFFVFLFHLFLSVR